MSGDWKYRRRDGVCAESGRRFAEGEEVFSLLRVADGELQRADLSRAAFERRDPDEDVVWWRTEHRERRGALRVDFDQLLAALPRLGEDRRAERRDLAYLLALLLVRHRRLRLERVERHGGRELLVLRKVRSRQRLRVESRELDEERRRALTERLGELLDPTREEGLEQLPDQDG